MLFRISSRRQHLAPPRLALLLICLIGVLVTTGAYYYALQSFVGSDQSRRRLVWLSLLGLLSLLMAWMSGWALLAQL